VSQSEILSSRAGVRDKNVIKARRLLTRNFNRERYAIPKTEAPSRLVFPTQRFRQTADQPVDIETSGNIKVLPGSGVPKVCCESQAGITG
jgi:FAD synthase